MKLRKVRLDLLIWKAIAYRIFVLCTQMIFMWILTHDLTFSVGVSIAWNILNTAEYFGFDYIFARLYKVGKNDNN
jgi:hypothetical protein